MKYLLILGFLAVSAALRRQSRTQFNQSQPAQWPDFYPRLQQSIATTNALGDPCKAQVMLNHFYWGAGTGSKINCMAAAIIIALQGVSVPSMALCGVPGSNQEGQNFYTNMWLPNFKNGLAIPVCGQCPGGTDPNTLSSTAAKQISDQGGQISQLHTQSPAGVRSWRKEILTRFFTLQQPTASHIDQTLADLALGVDYIGIHIRHTDKITSGEAEYIDGATYADRARAVTRLSSSQLMVTAIQKLKQAVELHGIKTVFLATDDPASLQQLQSALPTIMVKMAPRVDESLYHYQAVGRDNSANLALLTDIVCLMRSKVFLGTGSSNLGRLVWTMRGEAQRQRDISLDAPFDQPM